MYFYKRTLHFYNVNSMELSVTCVHSHLAKSLILVRCAK